MSHKSFDERLSYHVRRFQGKQPRNVLKRYEQRLHVALKSDELQKYAFHVAAWVAELPAEQMYLQYDGLFAVSLLQQYVRSFKQAKPLCEHLTKVLTRVSERLNTDSELEMQWPGLLQDLKHFVPEAKATKGARLMNKAVQYMFGETLLVRQSKRSMCLHWKSHFKKWKLMTCARFAPFSAVQWLHCLHLSVCPKVLHR